MELYDDEVEQKKSKPPMILGVSIAILVILTILIIGAIIYLKSTITTIQINGERNTALEDIFYIEQTENGLELYAPILKMANFFGYEGYVGDYKDKSEDNTKCHVISKNETAMFTLDKNVLIKINQNSELEYVSIDKNVFERNGELYTTVDGIQKAFNVQFSYDEELKNIKIYTMDYLVKLYATSFQVSNYANGFSDQKAILEGRIIVKQNNKYGVIDVFNRQYILEAKYEDIAYIPVTSDFLVKSNGKYGIVSKDSKVKVDMIYDEIKMVDSEKGLFLIKQNNTYGILDTNSNVILEPEYKNIGIGIEEYRSNGVENKFILLDEIIPVQNNEGLWGFFNLKGEKIVDFKYKRLGSLKTNVNNSSPVLVIPSYKCIVVQEDNGYKIISTLGEDLLGGSVVDSIYLKLDVKTKLNKYYMTYNNNTINIEEWLASQGR